MSNNSQNEKELFQKPNVFDELRDATKNFDKLKDEFVEKNGAMEWQSLIKKECDAMDNEVLTKVSSVQKGVNDVLVHP